MNWLYTALLLTAIDLLTSQATCPTTECNDGLRGDIRCWNSTPSEIRVGWGFKDFGVCLSPENCFPRGVNDGTEYGGKLDEVNFTYQVKPIIVQTGDTLVFHSLEDDLQLDLVMVSEQYFQDCGRVGIPLQTNITRNEIRINSNDLNPGENFIIHKGRRNDVYRCDFGLKMEIFVKGNMCGGNSRQPMCSGHGECVSGQGKDERDFRCSCCKGYSGVHCDYFRPQFRCSTSPCKNGGTCVATNNIFECTCPTGFTGRICGNEIKELVNPTVDSKATSIADRLEWITVQTQISSLSCQMWQENTTKQIDLLDALYKFIRDELIPTATGYCQIGGTNYGLDFESRDLICYNNRTVFRVSLTTPSSSLISTAELLCITHYYLDKNTAKFNVFDYTFEIDSSFPLPVYSLPANEIDCDDPETMEGLCTKKESYGIYELPSKSPYITDKFNITYPKEGGTAAKRKGHSPWIILYIMIPICLLLILIMAIGLYLWKRKYVRSYTFRENVRLAKIAKSYGRPDSMNVETQLKRKEYLYGDAQNGDAKNGAIPDRQVSASPVPGSANSTLQLPPRTRMDSDTRSKRSSRASDVRRLSSDDVKILALQPREDNSPHGYENRAFQFIDDKEESSDVAADGIDPVAV
ncbi:uncharacterized protein LOC144444757 isoform X2 [Glandiceps talaboti]